MDITLKKTSCDETGFFGELLSPAGAHLIYVASHAYQQDDGSWAMKVQPGQYLCVGGMHQIMNGPNHTLGQPFKTFEVTGVVGHSGILLGHVGNWPQLDSDGCFLTGLAIATLSGKPAVISSTAAYNQFMSTQLGVSQFTLTVLP